MTFNQFQLEDPIELNPNLSNQNQEKTQNRKSRDRNKKYHKMGDSPALLRAGEREKRGRRFNRSTARPRTCLVYTRHRGRKTTRRRIELHGGISPPATGGHHTRRLNRAWGVKKPGACDTRTDKTDRNKNLKKVNYRTAPVPI